jgi:hypothetical protein
MYTLFCCINYSEIVNKYNEIWECIYLILAHLTCIVLQSRKFHCVYPKLQDKNSYEIYSLVVTEENKDSFYNLNFSL